MRTLRTWFGSGVRIAPAGFAVEGLFLSVTTALVSGCCGTAVCAGSPLDPSGELSVRIDEGDGQFAPALARVPVDLSVKVTDRGNGDPMPGVCVSFAIETGGGVLIVVPPQNTGCGPQATVTNQQGVASAGLVLGPPGETQVKVTFVRGGVPLPNFLRFTLTGHGAPSRIEIITGDGQSGEVGSELPSRPAVKITDAGGIQVPGLRVWFFPEDGGQPIDGEVNSSSNSGVAAMPSRWRLGPSVGPQRLQARVLVGATGATLANLPGNPVTFTATAVPATARNVTRNPVGFPEPQSGTSGVPVTVTPSVRVTDGGGNPMAGVPVRFAITAGGGSFGGGVTVRDQDTDASGVVSVPTWLLGSAGANTVTATVLASGVVGNPVTFTATAGVPYGIELLVNPGFESPVSVGALPTSLGVWRGDLSQSIGAERGVTPFDGTRMLRFDATGPTGPGLTFLSSQQWQLVDVSGNRADIDAGRATVDASVLFNRVAGTAATDTRFNLVVTAFSGSPSAFPADYVSGNGRLGTVLAEVIATTGLNWHTAAVNMELPPGTTYLAVEIYAYENVTDDATNEFDGHYADRASLILRRKP